MSQSGRITAAQHNAADTANLGEVAHALGWFYCCAEPSVVAAAVNVTRAAAVEVRSSSRDMAQFGVWVEKPSGTAVELMLGPYPEADEARQVMLAVLDHAFNNATR